MIAGWGGFNRYSEIQGGFEGCYAGSDRGQKCNEEDEKKTESQ